MPAVVAAIGLFASGIGIYSFYSGQDDPIERQFEIDQIRNDLANLQTDLETLIVNQNLASALGDADSALDALRSYAASEDATERAAFALEARNKATDALNDVISQVDSARQTATVESLAYSHGALQYAMLVRQTVANTVEDGPLGGAGVHLRVKEAAQLLYDQNNGDDLYSEFPRAISERIEVSDIDVNFIGTKIEAVVASSISGSSETVEVTRKTLFTDTFIPIPFPESDAAFEKRANDAVDAAFDRIYAADYADLKVDTFLDIGVEANTWLAQDSINVSGLYERIGSSAPDLIDGTSRADYLTGLGGDDELWGNNGPDAISGGSGNDILRGGAIQDVLVGGLGNDFLIGNERVTDPIDGDTARFAGLASEYTVKGGSSYATVSGPDGSKDKLFNIEFLRFDDVVYALEDGSALDNAGSSEDFDVSERVALLYEAALDRDGAIDLPGLNFYIGVTENDRLSDEFLANDMMQSPEFTEKFGDANTLSNAEFLERIYLNVLDRDSDAEGRQFYLDLLDDGVITKALALADIAISPENAQGSTQTLMTLYENSDGEWRFVSDGMEMA
ncbi:MAG: DUF4214 domain-containing protein [Sulfitobacter sp.]